MRTWNRIAVLATIFCLMIANGLTAQEPAKGEAKPRLKILDEQPRFLILTGGGQLTKPMEAKRFADVIQRHYGNKSPHPVEVVETHATTAREWADVLRPALAKAKEKGLPIVVLAHLPPLVMKPNEKMVPRSEKDVERIRAYGDVFAEYAQRVREAGADLVVLGMEGAVGPNKSNPQAAGTHAHLWRVSDEVAGRSLPGVAVGPRIFQTFDKNRQLYVKNDHHITKNGKILVTHLWYQALCRLDGIAVPAWSQMEVDGILKK